MNYRWTKWSPLPPIQLAFLVMALYYQIYCCLLYTSTPQKDRLLYEKKPDVHFAGALVARQDNKNSAKIKVLKEVLTSDEIRDYITNELPSEAEVAF